MITADNEQIDRNWGSEQSKSIKGGETMEVFKIRKKIIKKKYKLPTFMPSFPSSNYQLSPKESELRQMTEKQLKRVIDFSISNEYGRIEFLEPVDLTYQNIGVNIQIKNNQVKY